MTATKYPELAQTQSLFSSTDAIAHSSITPTNLADKVGQIMENSASSGMGPARSGSSSSKHQQDRNLPSKRGSGSRPFRGGRGGRGRGDSGGKKRNMGRSEWSKSKPDKRTANDESQAVKKQKLDNGEAALPVYATKFDQEELDADVRRPKKKVAVMIGYSGTGYKGMQLAPDQKTIEGDLFKAFVEAGAISKANADDPKKSSFVRCARTDKGVHAAGNIISLKLIVEDEDIVQRINNALTPQIRVWGFERTNGSFSAYQLCDSRIYEYVIPTHSLLPPHPKSYMGKKCREWAERKSEVAQWEERQKEVEGFWEKVDEEMVKPILDEYPEDIRDILEKALWLTAEQEANKQADTDAKPLKQPKRPANANLDVQEETSQKQEQSNDLNGEAPPVSELATDTKPVEPTNDTSTEAATSVEQSNNPNPNPTSTNPLAHLTKEERITRRKTIDEAVKRLRAAYLTAKRSYRVPETRRDRLSSVLQRYLGTNNFWNYTVQKTYRDPSAKRVMKSIVVNPTPILIDGTEWLSIKIHGQSFMMHQIRKMIGMAALIVRCGCDPSRIRDSYGSENMSIPKAPSLGLLLERPVFDSYNRRAKGELSKEPISFDKYTTEMDAFKQKFIYERMYEDEERENVFGNFFNHVDNFPSNTFLFVTSGGLEASGEADGADVGAWVGGEGGDGNGNGHGKSGDVDSDDDEQGVRLDHAGDEG